jgi:hypothetical protein
VWESVSPVFPFYVPLVAMLAMLPVMRVKFKLAPDTSEAIDGVAEVSAAAAANLRRARRQRYTPGQTCNAPSGC